MGVLHRTTAATLSALILLGTSGGCRDGTVPGELSRAELRRQTEALEALEPMVGFSPIPTGYVPDGLVRTPGIDYSGDTVFIIFTRDEGATPSRDSVTLKDLHIIEASPVEFEACDEQSTRPLVLVYLCQDLLADDHQIAAETSPVATDKLWHRVSFQIGDVLVQADFTWEFTGPLPGEPTKEMREEALRVAESMLSED